MVGGAVVMGVLCDGEKALVCMRDGLTNWWRWSSYVLIVAAVVQLEKSRWSLRLSLPSLFLPASLCRRATAQTCRRTTAKASSSQPTNLFSHFSPPVFLLFVLLSFSISQFCSIILIQHLRPYLPHSRHVAVRRDEKCRHGQARGGAVGQHQKGH